MRRPVKSLSFAVASWLFSVSSPQPLIAIASDVATSITQDSQSRAEQLFQEGIQQLSRNQLLAAAQTLEQALEIYRTRKDTESPARQVEIIKSLVRVYTSLRDSSKVAEFSQVGLAIAQKLGSQAMELEFLNALGNADNALGKYQQAVESATASLALAQKLQNSQAQAAAFVLLASAYQAQASHTSEYQKALRMAISGLTIAWVIEDHDSEAKALAILGSLDSVLGHDQNALVFSQSALKIAKENNIPTVAASSLLTLADIQLRQEEYQKAVKSTEQGRNYLQKLQQRETAGAISMMEGLAYLGQGNIQKSVYFVQQGLEISREVKNPLLEALALIVLSLDSSHSRDHQRAIELINQSLAIARDKKNHNLEALILEVRGGIYRNSGQIELAIASYQQADSINDSYTAKAELASLYEQENLVGTAITYYKLAINKNEQQVQELIPGLPIWLQESFPQAVQDISGIRTTNIYRSLANLLLRQKRIGEAQQVLELLKGQELREYTGGGSETSGDVASLTITPTEEQILKEYGSLIGFGYRLDQCEQTHCPQLEHLAQKRAILTKQYYQELEQLEIKVRNYQATDEAFIDPNHFVLKAREIVEAQPDTVLIYPLVLEDKIWLIWVSKGGIFKSLEVRNVNQAQMAATVFRFRQLLQDRLSKIDDVKTTGKQLYDLLVKPLENELKANNIHNLVFSLDRSTRYIPMGTLFDGKKYLIENYSVSTILSANLTHVPLVVDNHRGTRLVLSPQTLLTNNQNPTVLALGVSDAIAGFKSLPNVPTELDAIVRQSGETHGIFDGQEFLNKAFDFFALRDNLPSHQILHIATHSKFVPGKAYKSYLLLGSGEKLEIPEIQTWLNLHHVDLVVLSACETALGGTGTDGKEVAAIGYYFLKGGAKSVIASLWNVDDRSTRLLMKHFYENLAKGTPTSPVQKAEALRQAQLALLNGQDIDDVSTPSNVPQERRPNTFMLTVEQQGNSQQPVAKKSPFRHPYYWAPFIMMGSGL